MVRSQQRIERARAPPEAGKVGHGEIVEGREVLVEDQRGFVESHGVDNRWLLRGYARGGLTATIATAPGPIQADPLSTSSFTGTQSFAGSGAIGFGRSWSVKTRTNGTHRGSPHWRSSGWLGTQSLEKVNALADSLPDN